MGTFEISVRFWLSTNQYRWESYVKGHQAPNKEETQTSNQKQK